MFSIATALGNKIGRLYSMSDVLSGSLSIEIFLGLIVQYEVTEQKKV